MKNLTFFLIIVLGVLATAELAAIISTSSPYAAGKDVIWAFFGSLFVSLFSVFFLLWYSIKRFLIYRFSTPGVWSSVRQAALLAAVLVLCTLFNSLGILSPWDSLPLFLSAVLIEFFFQADKSSPHVRHDPS